MDNVSQGLLPFDNGEHGWVYARLAPARLLLLSLAERYERRAEHLDRKAHRDTALNRLSTMTE